MGDPPVTYGLLLRREVSKYLGNVALIAEVVKREGDHHAPRNCGQGWPWESGHYLDGLTMRGFVADSEPFNFIGFDPEYVNVFTVDEHKAKRMATTLHRV